MSNLPIAGATYDHYREQVFNNPSTYAASGTQVCSDDYRENITPATPSGPSQTPNSNYGTQPTQAAWHTRNKGDLNVSQWTTTFPAIPGT